MTNQSIEISNIDDLKSKLGIDNLQTSLQIQRPFSLTNAELQRYKDEILAMSNDNEKISKIESIIREKEQITGNTQVELSKLLQELNINEDLLKNAEITPDAFKTLLESAETLNGEKKILLLSSIFSILNQFGVSIEGLNKGKIELHPGKETKGKKIISRDNVISFQNIINNSLSGNKINIGEIQKALLYRTSGLEKYTNLEDINNMSDYAFRLLNKYNITIDSKEIGNLSTKEYFNKLSTKTEEEYQYFIDSIKNNITDNQADKEFLISYFDDVYYNQGNSVNNNNWIKEYKDNKTQNKDLITGLTLLNTLDDSIKYALGLRNTDTLAAKKEKGLNDPLGFITDGLNNGGGVLGVLLGLLMGIFGKKGSFITRLLAGLGIGVGAGAVGMDGVSALAKKGADLGGTGVDISYNWLKGELSPLGNISQEVYEKGMFWYEFNSVKISDGTGIKNLFNSNFFTLVEKANSNIGEFKKDGNELSPDEKTKLKDKLNEYKKNLEDKYPNKSPNEIKAEFENKTLKEIIIEIFNSPASPQANTPTQTSPQNPPTQTSPQNPPQANTQPQTPPTNPNSFPLV